MPPRLQPRLLACSGTGYSSARIPIPSSITSSARRSRPGRCVAGLAQFHNPVPEVANQSVRAIMTEVWLGSFARGLHFWAAQAMFVFAGLHLARVHCTAPLPPPANPGNGSAAWRRRTSTTGTGSGPTM